MEPNSVQKKGAVDSEMTGHDATDSEHVRELKTEDGSMSSEGSSSDTSSVRGIKPRSFYSGQNKRQSYTVRRQSVCKPQSTKTVKKASTPKGTAQNSRTPAVKRRRSKCSNVSAKKIRKSSDYKIGNGTISKDKVSTKCNGQITETKCSDEGSASCSLDLQEVPSCSSSDVSDTPSIHSVQEPLWNGYRKSVLADFELNCSEDSFASGPGSVGSSLVLKTNGTEYYFTSSRESSPGSDSTISEKNKERSESPTSEAMVTSSNSSQNSLSLFLSSNETSESSFKLSSARSSPENQASITKYFKSLPGRKSKRKKMTQENGRPTCALKTL